MELDPISNISPGKVSLSKASYETVDEHLLELEAESTASLKLHRHLCYYLTSDFELLQHEYVVS